MITSRKELQVELQVKQKVKSVCGTGNGLIPKVHSSNTT